MRWIPVTGLALVSPAAWAHAGHVHEATPGWTLDPWVIVPLGALLGLFVAGFVRLGRRARSGSKLASREWQFLAGWFILAGSLVSPLHEAGERSFSLHMIEHELIMLAAALLLAASRPFGIVLWAFPHAGRRVFAGITRWRWLRRLWGWVSEPVIATSLQAAALLLWHAPPLFNRALEQPTWHIFQHLSFLLTALLFWSSMLSARNQGLAALCLFATSLIGGGLGALMSLSASPWYPAYALMDLSPLGLSPQQDQALAGLIMWIPGGAVHAGAALLLLSRYLTMPGRPHASE
jgi:cytochrome c oxidase assembly factor CtaG